MKRAIKFTTLTACVALVSACASENATRNQFNSEAGAVIDGGFFGNATMNNTQVQNGDIKFLQDMGARFANEVETTVTFEFNKAVLDDAARLTLKQQANYINQFPELRFSVYGHTDAVGSDAYNVRLGRARALAAVNYLVSQGVSRTRLDALVSFGERQPIVATQEKERRNRRTVTEVAGLVSTHPLVLNGKYADVIFREYREQGATLESELGGITGSEVQTGS
ncbi:MAG: OmpA family protein [Pseudomonadota bacterium]